MFVFSDEDGSGITAEDSAESPDYMTYVVRAPSKSHSLITVKYFYQASTAGVRASLEGALRHMVTSGVKTRGFTVCGLDTETGPGKAKRVELIQLSVDNVVVLIRRCLFNSEFLGPFFLNTLFPDHTIIFAGAELATADALDLLAIKLPVEGLLDLTSVLSQDHGDGFDNPRRLSLHLSDNAASSLSLRAMYSGAFDVPWVKDKAITMSDWAAPRLSPPQIKYAVLDAWTGAELGRMALVKFRKLGIYQMLFSTNNRHVQALADSEGPAAGLLAQQILAQVKALDELAFKDPKQVVLSNMQENPRSRHSCIDVISSSYGNHIRTGAGIEIRVISPGGSSAGLCVMTRAKEVKGKKSTIELDPEWRALMLENMDRASDADKKVAAKLAPSACNTIVCLWREEFDATGSYAACRTNSALGGPAPHIGSGRHFIKIRLVVVPEKDKLLRQVRLSVSDFVRSHFVPRGFFPAEVAAEAKSELDAFEMSHQQGARAVKTIHSLAWQILSREPFNNASPVGLTGDQQASMSAHQDNLNASQGQALVNAFSSRVSVIKGPPGTGKTRTIASIADVALTAGRRALIIAPGNSASRRILESLVKTGFEEACLLVSEEYFYEWHEEAYEGESLGQYVHTKSTFVDASRGTRAGSDGTAEGRAARDFRERSQTEHVSKWLEVANGTDTAEASKPVVVIGTHGAISFNGVGESKSKGRSGGTKASGKWAGQVQNIVAIQSIDMLIIDETSQLWSGYGLSLLSRLPALKNIILVGDEDQLPPFGVTQVPTLRSLFDAAIMHPDIPRAVLNVTYRLPRPIATLLSQTIYESNLTCERYPPADLAFQQGLEAVVREATRSQVPQLTSLRLASFDARTLLQRLCSISPLPPSDNHASGDASSSGLTGPFPSLLWVHHDSPAHKNSAQSIGNVKEAKVIVSLVAQLLSMLHARPTPGERSIAAATKIVIITGYLEQKDELERQLAQALFSIHFKGLNEVELVDFVKSSMIVNTTDSFQGQEAEIVFISCVRSLASNPGLKGLGFAKDQRRSNVMLSRSSQLMVVVGDALNMAAELGKTVVGRGPGGVVVARPLLLPALASWCSSHASMYTIDRASASLNSFALPLGALPIAATPAVRGLGVVVAVAAAPPPAVAPRVVPLTREGFAAMNPLHKSIALALVDVDGRALPLSQLASKIPREQRLGHRSFIAPVRLMACVALSQTRTGDWIATLSVSALCATAQALLRPPPPVIAAAAATATTATAATIAPAALPLPDPALAAFGEAVTRTLWRGGGTMSMSDLGVAIPRAQRPGQAAKLLPLLSGLAGVQVTHNRRGTAFVRLVGTDSIMSVFAALVRFHLERAGGSMTLLSLSGLIPKNARPPLVFPCTRQDGYWQVSALQALRIHLDAAFGSEVAVGGKKKGLVTLRR